MKKNHSAQQKPFRDFVDVLVIAALVFTMLKAAQVLFQLTHNSHL